MAIKPGERAPLFSLRNAVGDTVSLADLKGRNVILYFYPKDDTPGCTIEARQFSGLLDAFEERNTLVYGISMDDVESHREFIQKCDLGVPLLADTDGIVCDAYGVLEDGRIRRTTFLIDEDGKVAHVWVEVKPEGHAEDVLLQIQSA